MIKGVSKQGKAEGIKAINNNIAFQCKCKKSNILLNANLTKAIYLSMQTQQKQYT